MKLILYKIKIIYKNKSYKQIKENGKKFLENLFRNNQKVTWFSAV